MESIKDTQPASYKAAMKLYKGMDERKDVIYYSAPVILFVIGPTRYAESCVLACENIMLAATSLDLGSCYVGFGSMVKGDADVVQTLELKDDERIYGPIVLGYPKDDPEALAPNQHYRYVEPKIKWI